MSDWFFHFLWLLLLFLPAFVANGLPVIVQNIAFLKPFSTPILPQYLGNHKTYRGFVAGILGGALVGGGLFFTSLFSFSVWELFLMGGTLGFGALFGDAVESFIKRRIGKKPGEALPFFDGIDYILGALLFILPWYFPMWYDVLFLLLLGPTLSLLCNTVAYLFGWKDVWY